MEIGFSLPAGLPEPNLGAHGEIGPLYLFRPDEPEVQQVTVSGIETTRTGGLRSFGRGSRLYFWTDDSLWMVDATTLPST